MSLIVDPSTIVAVLLSDGKWYMCEQIEFDSFGYDRSTPPKGDGSETGFRLVTDEADALGTKIIYGPRSSIVAVEKSMD
jgi:hypothetical protein